MCIDEYLAKNIMNNNKRLNRIEIEYESFQKLLTSSCISREIRRKFWNIQTEPLEAGDPISCCSPMEGDQLRQHYTPA